MERDLLSRVTGDSSGQGHDHDPRPPPSPTLSLRVGAHANHGHGHEPQQAQAQAAATAPNVDAQLPSSSRLPFAPDGVLPSVLCPMSERRHNLRAGASREPVQEQRAAPAGPAPHRPRPMAPPVLELAVAGPTVTMTGPGQPERCDACGASAWLLRGLSSELDRARAQVALLTCQNESLRHRLKRASAAHLSLRCGACRVRPATVLLVPREHLCLCGHCSSSSRDGGAAVACPVCRRGAVGTWPAEAATRWR